MRWQFNPVLLKELRSRMRGARAFVILTLSLLLLAGICSLVYAVVVLNSSYLDADLGTTIGRILFGTLAIGETLLVCILTPGMSSSAISTEDERKTLEMLLVTPLKHHTILWGKLFSSLAYIALLVLAMIPLGSLILLFGGVSPGEMLLVLLLLAVFALAFGCLGLFCSLAFRRAGWARGVALAVVVFVMGGSLFFMGTVGLILTMRPGGGDPLWFLVVNPIAVIVEVVISDSGQMLSQPMWVYTLGGYLVWAATLYGGSLLLLRHRRSGRPGERRRALPVLTMIGMGLLTFFAVGVLPALLTWFAPP